MKDHKKTLGALLGNTMQFYDFTLYAFLAPQIKQAFFDFENKYLSYIIVFGVFACGYLTRPIGAVLFGYLGDKRGRSYTLSITIILATLTTFSIGILPGYHILGIMSPLLVVMLRLFQGIAVSGEEGSAVVLLFEKFAFKKKCLLGSIVLSSVLMGVLLGTSVCTIVGKTISYQSYQEWGWRVPFLMALPLGGIATTLRFYLNDFKLFIAASENNLITKSPLKSLLREHWSAIIFCFFIVAPYSITTSTVIVHFPYYLAEVLSISQNSCLLLVTLTIMIIMILTPISAVFLDQFDVFKVYQWSLLGTIIWAPIMFWAFNLGNLAVIIASLIILSALIAIISSTIFALLVGEFPYGVRCSGVALSFNLSITLFSSTTPIALVVVEHHLNPTYGPGMYMAALLSLSVIAATLIHKSVRKTLCERIDESFLYQT